MTEKNDQNGKVMPHPVLPEYFSDEVDRVETVSHMFDESAKYYDRINSVMSFGSGVWYRREALQRAGVTTGKKVLDIGCGTGVVAFEAQKLVGETGEVLAVDPSPEMLKEAQKRGVKQTKQGRGEALPAEDGHYDVLTMGYALRHVPDLALTFQEYKRVLKPGGQVLLLEISQAETAIGKLFLAFYMRFLVPFLTFLVTFDRNSYKLMKYYWETIKHCVPPKTIIDTLTEAGFENVSRKKVMGIFSEYRGTKPASLEQK